MPNTSRVPSIPDVPENVPHEAKEWMEQIAYILRVRFGEIGEVQDKCPTVKDMTDASVTNAENII